jgi:glycosyltransferase involved in cell wall biosynthesis
MSKLPFVSVIIPTYNGVSHLKLTLDSFLQQSYPKDCYEIIIANNNSLDNTKKLLKQYCLMHKNVKTFVEKNQGSHYARNSAAKKAKGNILYFTDDDMIADANLLVELVKVFSLSPTVGSATGIVLPKFISPPPKWVCKSLINGYLSLTPESRIEELIITPNDIVFSCHQAVKKDVFFAAGGYNPDIVNGIWIGDNEVGLNLKIKELGFKFAYTAKSVIYHTIPESRTTLTYLINRLGNQGFSDSYSEYRIHRNKYKIFPLIIKRNLINFPKHLILIICKVLMSKLSWHFVPAWICYFYKRNIYDLKLLINDQFRKQIEIDDWIRNFPLINF